MTNFLNSLRSDLFSRRMVPLVVLACAGLIGAIVFAMGSSGNSTPTPAPTNPNTSTTSGALSAATAAPPSPTTNETVAETPAGIRYQHMGSIHNPFKSQPQPHAKASSTSKSTPSSSTSSSTSNTNSQSPGTSSTPSTGGSAPTQPQPQPKPKTVYTVNVEFGAATVPGEVPKLTLYKKVKVGDGVPTKNPLIVLKSANLETKALAEGTLNGSATFSLSTAPILKGPGICVPSTTQCEAIKLSVGQVEELQVLEPNGQNVTYLLRLAFIFKQIQPS